MRYDALVVGGSFAGLSAATYIARARRSVCVIDAGAPRNRFAAASHGFFGQDGQDPRAMIATSVALG
jgi:thioredoxin reductase